MIRALLGGSFDPIHVGHVALVRHILRHELAELVLVVPVWQSPFKDQATTPADHRLRMVDIALAGITDVRIDSREIDRGGVSYTVQTLGELAAEYPGDALRLVIGSDNLAKFFDWREPRRILALAEVLVYPRGDWQGTLPVELSDRAVVAAGFSSPASSTAVRRELHGGRLPGDALPDGVGEYIIAHGLYGFGGR